MKCEGLDDEQAGVASVPPSGLTLTGLVRHMAEVEQLVIAAYETGLVRPAVSLWEATPRTSRRRTWARG